MNEPPADERMSAESLLGFSSAAFVAAGMPDDYAAVLARSLVDADLHGVSTHGVVRIPSYLAQLRSGDVDPKAKVTLTPRSVASALIDGGGTFGAIAGTQAIDWAVEAARTTGIAMVGARNVAHFGAAGYFARLASSRGMIGMAMTNGAPAIVTSGGIDARLGNNPLAIAVPGDDRFCLDLAMSVVSRGKVKLTADAGEPVPEGWAIDSAGRPTTDAQAALDGALLPFGGYKGAGLALAVEVLAAALTGAQLSQDVRASGFTASAAGTSEGSVTVGHLFLVINAGIFRPLKDVEHDVGRIVSFVKDSKTLPGARVLIAGQSEAKLADTRSEDGIPISAGLKTVLNAAAAELGIAPLG